MLSRNVRSVAHNSAQGRHKRVLCVCSAGVLRSPTAAEVLSRDPYNYNTRSCGIEADFALIPLSEALIEWADEIVCMSVSQATRLQASGKPLICLGIQDSYDFRNPELIKLIKEKYDESIKEL